MPSVGDYGKSSEGRVNVCVEESRKICVPNGIEGQILLQYEASWDRQVPHQESGLAVRLVDLKACWIMRTGLVWCAS